MMGFILALQAAALSVAPPADWSALPTLRLANTPNYAGLMTGFVHGEVAAKRCAAPAFIGGRYVMKVDMAVLVSPTGNALKIVPRAINCPTVEQFAAGIVQKAARGNIAGTPPSSESWYRTGMTLSWGP